jgi:hypothetical protein
MAADPGFDQVDPSACRRSEAKNRVRDVVRAPVFRLLLGLEAHKALRLQYCFSVVWLTFEAEAAEPDALSRVAARCALLALRRLRGTDVITVFAPSTLGILLVDADASAVPQIFERLTESWSLTGPVGRLSWNAGVACYPRDGDRCDLLLAEAQRRMSWARSEGGNRVCVPVGGTDRQEVLPSAPRATLN